MLKDEFRILIVDDEKANLIVLSQILKENYDIMIAKSGLVALEMAMEEEPDLILLDIVMPDIDGFQVLTELKNKDATSKIPVIFITGLDDIENEEKGFFLGAVDYITKPFHPSIVKARVETHLKIVRQMRTIERLGLIDSMTEIPNRRSFDNHINIEFGQAIVKRTPLSLLMIDVDDFKIFNDTYGHQQGDVLLQKLARVLEDTLKGMTDLVFRWGGEEFAAILNLGLEDTMSAAEKLRENVETMKLDWKEDTDFGNVTVSIGVGTMELSYSDTIFEFISMADTALYQAKQSGKNKVCSNMKS